MVFALNPSIFYCNSNTTYWIYTWTKKSY